MNATLDLRTRRPQLEPDLLRLHSLVQLCNAPTPNVLQGMLNARIEVLQKRLDGALVLDVPRNALRDFDGTRFGKVTRGGGILRRRAFHLDRVLVAQFAVGLGRRWSITLFHRFLWSVVE